MRFEEIPSGASVFLDTNVFTSRQYGLLSGDALIVAVMQAHQLTCLASNDADFDRVRGVTRYSPV